MAVAQDNYGDGRIYAFGGQVRTTSPISQSRAIYVLGEDYQWSHVGNLSSQVEPMKRFNLLNTPFGFWVSGDAIKKFQNSNNTRTPAACLRNKGKMI